MTVPPGETTNIEKPGGIDQHEMANQEMMRMEIETHAKEAPNPGQEFEVNKRVFRYAVDFTRITTTFRRTNEGTRFSHQGFNHSPRIVDGQTAAEAHHER